MDQVARVELILPDPEATAALGRRLAEVVRPKDCLLLSGPVGAGKTHLARSLIQRWLENSGLWEDVPSPTFTLIQTYSNGTDEIWHADLYRLSDAQETDELGLSEALESSIVIVEWPEKLGALAPENALRLEFMDEGDGRRVRATGPSRLLAAIRADA